MYMGVPMCGYVHPCVDVHRDQSRVSHSLKVEFQALVG